MPHDIMDIVRITQELLREELSFATVTLIEIRGSAPQIVGAKAIVSGEGLVGGTIGGGKIEAAAIKHAQELLASPTRSTDLVTWNLQTEIGMTCGGEVKLFFEINRAASWPIAVFGAGHVAQALIPMLCQLNCRITCVDTRQEWLDRIESHPKLHKAHVENPVDLVDRFPPHTFFVLMSKGHTTDLPVLAHLLSTREAPYIGVIGSKQKASALKRDLKAQGIEDQNLNSFYCPIGLPIGNNTTAEIAISVIAQLIKVRDEQGVFEHTPKKF